MASGDNLSVQVDVRLSPATRRLLRRRSAGQLLVWLGATSLLIVAVLANRPEWTGGAVAAVLIQSVLAVAAYAWDAWRLRLRLETAAEPFTAGDVLRSYD
jgi:hypothetical protein